MGNIPGLSVEAGGTDNLPVVTQGIGWEMFNSTDENMEVLISAEQVQGATDCIFLLPQPSSYQQLPIRSIAPYPRWTVEH
jgi:hypothetical protein